MFVPYMYVVKFVQKHDLGSGLVAKTALDNGEVIVHLVTWGKCTT